MNDPISAAIAGGVAGKATEKILKYIDTADDPEHVWIRSGLEIAIQAETFYRQNLKDGIQYKSNRAKREIRGYGELSQELAIRGELRDFEPDKIQLLEEFGYACASLIDQPFGAGMEFDKQFEEELLDQIRTIKKEFKR